MLPEPIFFGLVHMYGLMIAIGILGTFITLTLGGKKLGINEKFLDFTFFLGIGAVAYALYYLKKNNPNKAHH